ncbi:glycoside hydrolase family 11 protein [Ruminococcus flavefaciens]|uniref:glycoside hydrolase family 11 protein n=2 Tax=Ruminococcus flavefaciens TaxID=1265 RepID=UPI0004ADB7D2|nr:glycoside hydrolase family 11 protein [Ruminococcus flavefaciens]
MKLTKIKKIFGGTLSALMIAASMPVVASAADQQTRGNIGGYDYEMWNQNGQGQASMNPGAGSFTCSWSNIENFLARMGKNYDSQKKNYKAFGNIVLTYDVEYTPRGNSYMCVYGWTRNPLMEYYIVEGWGDWRPPGNDGEVKGTVSANGNTYDIRKTMRYNQPSLDGTATFPQYWSVRQTSGSANNQTNYMKGTIDVTKHFDAWSAAGLDMSGTLYEVSLNIEGYRSNGSANVKSVSVTQGGSSDNGAQQQNNDWNQQNNNQQQNNDWNNWGQQNNDWNNWGQQNNDWNQWNNQGQQNNDWNNWGQQNNDWNNWGQQNNDWNQWNNQGQQNNDWNNWGQQNNDWNQWNNQGQQNNDWNNWGQQNNDWNQWNNQGQQNSWNGWDNNNNWNQWDQNNQWNNQQQNNTWDWNQQNNDWNQWNNQGQQNNDWNNWGQQNNDWNQWNNQGQQNSWNGWDNNNNWNQWDQNNQWNNQQQNNTWDWNNQNNWNNNQQNNDWNQWNNQGQQNNDWNQWNNQGQQNNTWDWNQNNNQQNTWNGWDNNNNWNQWGQTDWSNQGQQQNNDWNNWGQQNNDWNNQNNNSWSQPANNGGNNGNSKLVAISFDDGASATSRNDPAYRIMDALIKNNMTATFFYVSDWIKTNEQVQFAYQNGMEVANHTKSHQSLGSLGSQQIRSEWEQCNSKLKSIIGAEPSHIMRLPYLDGGGQVKSALYDVPLISCGLDTQDWNGASKDQIVNTIKQAAQNGSLEGKIVLCHENYASTAAAMEEVLPWLAQNGYKNVSVSEMFAARGKTLQGGQIYTQA